MSASQNVGYHISHGSLRLLYLCTAWSGAFHFDFRTDLLAPIWSYINRPLSPLNLVLPALFFIVLVWEYPQRSKWFLDSFHFLQPALFYALILIPAASILRYLDAIDTLQWHTLQWHTVFLTLTVLKGFKILVNVFSYLVLAVDTIHSDAATVLPRHVTVIIPTVGQLDQNFQQYVESIYANSPGQIIISTKGLGRLIWAKRVAKEINDKYLDEGRVIAMAMYDPNKRAHFIKAANVSKTKLIAHVEDHVIWPKHFLKHALAPFENRQVGLVGAVTSSNRDYSGGIGASIRNYIACLRIEQENFENTASCNVDGGVFNISGRTSLIRTEIVHSIAFRQDFLGERFQLPFHSLLSRIPLIGSWLSQRTPPMTTGDDNFITRHVISQGYKTIFLNSSNDEVRLTEANTRYATSDQITSWARTEQRHTITSLFVDRTIWSAYPWTTLTVFLPRLFPLNIIFDPLLIIALYQSSEKVKVTIIGLAVLYLTKLINAMLLFNRMGDWFWDPVYFFCSPILELYTAFHSLPASFEIFNTSLTKRDLVARSLDLEDNGVPYPDDLKARAQSIRSSDNDVDVVDEASQQMLIEKHRFGNVEHTLPTTVSSESQSDTGADVVDEMTDDEFVVGGFQHTEEFLLAHPELAGRVVTVLPTRLRKTRGQGIQRLQTAIIEAPWNVSVTSLGWIQSVILQIWSYLKRGYRIFDRMYRFPQQTGRCKKSVQDIQIFQGSPKTVRLRTTTRRTRSV